MKGKKILIFSLISFLMIVLFVYKDEDKSKNVKNKKVLLEENNVQHRIGTQTHIASSTVNVNEIKKNGFKIIRDDILWNNVEKEEGVYDYKNNGYDQYNMELKENGIRPYYILSYSNVNYETSNSVITNAGRKAYAKFVENTVKRYRNQNAIWEIWNEPNSSSFWNPTNKSAYYYVKLVKEASPKIQKHDPKSIIAAPALGEVNEITLKWLEEAFEEGLLDYIDVVSVHPYRAKEPESVIEDYKKIRSLIKKYTTREIPVISGEWGYSTGPAFYGREVSEVVQTQYLVRMFLINQYQNIPISIWYDWKNDGVDKDNGEHNFGLRNYDDSIPKIASTGAKNLIKLLGEYKFSKRIELNSNNDYLLEFNNSKGNVIYTYWTQIEDHPLEWPSNIQVNGRQIGMLGEQMGEIDTKSSSVILSNSPAYLIVNN